MKNLLFNSPKIIPIITLLTFALLISCSRELSEIPTDSEVESSFSEKTIGSSILGEKLKNPYTVENMREAFENLKNSQRASGNSNEIKATHYYVKFKPINEKDLDLIKLDTTLFLYEYPLDFEEVEGQESFRDPEIPEDQPIYQYASVKVGYSFPLVDYDILEDLFIPEDIKEEDSNHKITYSVDELVDEALRITGNLDEDEVSNEKRSKWRPAGRIKLWDDNYASHRPIEGVKVQARRWFRTVRGITNSNGYYSCNGRFRRKARYTGKDITL